uniref:NADH dehydrogenase subunit 2 n=1 Tax=Sphaeropleales sp. YC001 TaxID=1715688 RepID=A0A0N9HE12_9CHLO|nr:NADH dehydrogenase subunit 2 [Sphaeropleales sp. YC001]
MTLDLVILRPEFSLLFGFLVLLWYGTGGLVAPLSEKLTVAEPLRCVRIASSGRAKQASKAGAEQGANAGPAHAATALTLWRLLWCALSAALMFYGPLHSVFLGGRFQKDQYRSMLCGVLFLTGLLVLRVSYGWQKAAAIRHPEYVYLRMLALMGQYLLVQTTDLMSMYLCMELQSFSLVVLCGLNSKSALRLEAAMKYFLLSAFRSCLLLLGIGMIYWQTGETKIRILENIAERSALEPSLFLLLGIWFVSMGLLWKLAAAPLHFWVPDVYTGAWSSVSLWITVMPKIAVLSFWTMHWQALWGNRFGSTLAFFRILSMLIGAFAPLAQTSLKRLLAYSSIGHMGLLLMPLCGCGSRAGGSRARSSLGALWTHMFIYILTNLGVWALIMWPRSRPSSYGSGGRSRSAAGPQYIWDLKGLAKSSATAARRWAILMTSLAGLPPVYGFLGKALILWDSVNNGLYTTVAVALLYTLVGAVYYLKVMKVCYVDSPSSWRTYAKTNSITAYTVRGVVRLMMIGLWCGNVMFLFTHLAGLRATC